MSRSVEIEFQGYDEDTLEIVQVDELRLHTGFSYYWDDKDEVERVKNETLMRYTGRKDINGHKIFEHDLVKIFGEQLFEDVTKIGVIEIFPNGPYVDFPEEGASVWIGSLKDDCIEKIGNTYDKKPLEQQTKEQGEE